MWLGEGFRGKSVELHLKVGEGEEFEGMGNIELLFFCFNVLSE